MRSLYIYYRVETPKAQALWHAVTGMQQDMRNHMPGLAAALHQHLDAPAPDQQTWMETYHFNGHPSDDAWLAFEVQLDVRARSLPAGVIGDRHVERFSKMDTPPAHD